MESTIINARIPQAKKEAATRLLDDMGLTITDLITSSVDYLIEVGQIPEYKKKASENRDVGQFRNFVDEATLAVPWPEEDTRSYREIIAEGKYADYETLGAGQVIG